MNKHSSELPWVFLIGVHVYRNAKTKQKFIIEFQKGIPKQPLDIFTSDICHIKFAPLSLCVHTPSPGTQTTDFSAGGTKEGPHDVAGHDEAQGEAPDPLTLVIPRSRCPRSRGSWRP